MAIVVVAAGVVARAMTMSLAAQPAGSRIVTRQVWTVLPTAFNRTFPESGTPGSLTSTASLCGFDHRS